jgi:hypothetical protein
MAYGGYATAQAMRDYVASLGQVIFMGDPELVETAWDVAGTPIYRQNLIEFFAKVLHTRSYDYYQGTVEPFIGMCWFKDEPYVRSIADEAV